MKIFGLIFVLIVKVVADFAARVESNDEDDLSRVNIKCPSGSMIYVNPNTDDVEQCEQTIGFYSKICPIGTACERFPIKNPKFRDFCCHVKEPTQSPKIVVEPSTVNIAYNVLAYTVLSFKTYHFCGTRVHFLCKILRL